ncbi:MAG: YggS family pyridoxal phosphate-dependent enzyme [Gammaproteobacteria bacterium]|nr:MAG: YggS family pyridoxal phosphate-dependent enzyme [Gammaproteobacteria bacterium]
MEITKEELIENLQRVRENIEKACQRAGRPVDSVKLLGATKTKPSTILRWAYEAGLKVFGENRVQEFLKKWEELRDLPDIEWHFIGRLQSNKVKYIIDKVRLIHSVDRPSLVDELQKRATKKGIKEVDILVEVNVGEEETKGGVKPEETPKLFEYILKNAPALRIRGLMAIPPYREDSEEVRPYFVKLRELRDKLAEEFNLQLPELSMGMSHDYTVAIEEGATIIRVGSAIFGERK